MAVGHKENNTSFNRASKQTPIVARRLLCIGQCNEFW